MDARLRALLIAALLVAQATAPAWAGTTGTLDGTVTDQVTHAPIGGVKVTASAPTGRYSGVTDAHGFFSIGGVYSDTYSVSFEAGGYLKVTVPGVAVFADQVATENQALSHDMRTIATVRASGISSAFQPSQTTDTVTVNSDQIQNLLGSPLAINEETLLTSLPGTQVDASGYPVIHGGREYEEGYEFEGIPYVDAFTHQFGNSFFVPGASLAAAQLTVGAGDASQGGGGTGAFNVIMKRGTYPSYFDVSTSVSVEGGYDHRLQADYSWATPDGRFSDYASFTGENDEYVPANLGKYSAAQLSSFYNYRLASSRELLNNFIYRFGRSHTQSLQLFTDFANSTFDEGLGGNAGLCFASCDPVYTTTWSNWFGLSPATVQAITPLYPYQHSNSELLTAANYPTFSYNQPDEAFKLEYNNNLNASTFLDVRYYRTNMVFVQDRSDESEGSASDYWDTYGGQASGLVLDLQKQLSDKDQLRIGTQYQFNHPINEYLSAGGFLAAAAYDGYFPDHYAVPFAFVNPNNPSMSCPSWATCGYAYPGYSTGSIDPSQQLTYPMYNEIASAQREDYSAYISNRWSPSDRLTIDGGLRLETVTYLGPKPGMDPATCTSLYAPATSVANPNYDASDPIGNGNCPNIETFNVGTRLRPQEMEPRLALAYQFEKNSSIRLTFGKDVQFEPLSSYDWNELNPAAYAQYAKMAPISPTGTPVPSLAQALGNTTNCGIIGYTVPCQNFGQQLMWTGMDGSVPFQPLLPTEYYNYEASLQHQFSRGALRGVAVSISPWYRTQKNTNGVEASPLLTSSGQLELVNGSPVFGPNVLTNGFKEFASGVDLNVTTPEPASGIFGQFTASYINEFSSVIPTVSGEDYYPSISPQSVLLGNVYRVGFVSPFQSTLAITYKTRSGWRITPRYVYDIGYPTGLGTSTAALVNNTPVNLPNTDAVIGSAPNGPAYYVDPDNPGSLFDPTVIASRGYGEHSSPGGRLSPANSYLDLAIEYGKPGARVTYGASVANIFNEIYTGSFFNYRYQPIATGVSGPLSGYSTYAPDYTNYPGALAKFPSFWSPSGVFSDVPNGTGRSLYLYAKVRL